MTLSGQKLAKPRRVIVNVEWHPGELYPHVGYIVTNMARSAENVVAFYNKRGTCEQWIQGRKRRDQVDTAVALSPPTGFAFSFMRLKSRQLPANPGDAGDDRGLDVWMTTKSTFSALGANVTGLGAREPRVEGLAIAKIRRKWQS